jgi:uncharacterized damage-inducible protein DinB
MTPAITFEELAGWSDEAAKFWKAHLEANPSLLGLPCDVGGAATVQEFVRHIWTVELRWAEGLAGLPETAKDAIPTGPLDALFDLHVRASQIFGKLLADREQDWEATYTLMTSSLPPEKRTATRRKLMGHALLHGQRHWAQLATLLRTAGFPTDFGGDLFFSSALR